MEIRKYKNEDSITLSSLIIDCLNKTAKDFITKKQLNFLINGYFPEFFDFISGTYDTFVGVENGEIIGTIGLSKGGDRITSFFIKSTKIGKGYGTQMLNYIEKISKERGSKLIRLYSSGFAQQFYKKHGFRFVEIDDDKSCGKMYVMEKTI